MKSTDSNAAFCFRRKTEPVTEENMKPDVELVEAMIDAEIRVQDLIVELHNRINGLPSNSSRSIAVEAFIQDYVSTVAVRVVKTISEGNKHEQKKI